MSEEIDVQPGTYYFEDEYVSSNKFTLMHIEDGYQDFTLETLYFQSNKFGVIIREDGAWDEEDLPYNFKQFILGEAGKDITKEEFEKEKQEVINRIVKCTK